MKKNSKIGVLVLVFIILITIIGIYYISGTEKKQVANQENGIVKIDYDNIDNGFFIWMDAYVALPVKSEFNLVATYYYFSDKDNYIHSADISSVTFKGNDNIEVKEFAIQSLDVDYDDYNGYGIVLTVEANEIGESSAESLVVQLLDGTQYECPLGNWYFDVDVEDSGIVDAYSAIMATSSSYKLPYEYLVDAPYTISELQYWHDKEQIAPIKKSDTIELETKAPFNYIKTKGLVTKGEEESRFYGLGCYLGIIGSPLESIKVSYEHNKMN